MLLVKLKLMRTLHGKSHQARKRKQLRSSTVDLQRPRSALVTAKADKDAVVDDRLRSTLITVKADKGAVVDNRLRSSTVDLQRPRSTLVTAKADKDAVVDDRLRSWTIDSGHCQSR